MRRGGGRMLRMGVTSPGLCPVYAPDITRDPSHQLDSRTVRPAGGQRGITRDERGCQRLGQRKIGRVIRRHGLARLPDPVQEELVGIANEREIDEILQRVHSTLNAQRARSCISAQHLSNLEVEEVRRVQRLTSREESRGDAGSVGRLTIIRMRISCQRDPVPMNRSTNAFKAAGGGMSPVRPRDRDGVT